MEQEERLLDDDDDAPVSHGARHDALKAPDGAMHTHLLMLGSLAAGTALAARPEALAFPIDPTPGTLHTALRHARALGCTLALPCLATAYGLADHLAPPDRVLERRKAWLLAFAALLGACIPTHFAAFLEPSVLLLLLTLCRLGRTHLTRWSLAIGIGTRKSIEQFLKLRFRKILLAIGGRS